MRATLRQRRCGCWAAAQRCCREASALEQPTAAFVAGGRPRPSPFVPTFPLLPFLSLFLPSCTLVGGRSAAAVCPCPAFYLDVVGIGTASSWPRRVEWRPVVPRSPLGRCPRGRRGVGLSGMAGDRRFADRAATARRRAGIFRPLLYSVGACGRLPVACRVLRRVAVACAAPRRGRGVVATSFS